jgi:hypothetical protein
LKWFHNLGSRPRARRRPIRTRSNRIDNLSQIIISSSTSYYRIEERKKGRHPVCVAYIDLLDQIKNDKVLTSIFEDRNKSEREAKELQRGIDKLKGAYDTSLPDACL